MADTPALGRRAFLELAAVSSVAAAAGVAGCQNRADVPPGADSPTPLDPGTMWVAPLRAADIPDDVEPAMVFRPLPQPGRA